MIAYERPVVVYFLLQNIFLIAMAERIRNSETAENGVSFGWYYFQFVTPSGTMINSIAHETDMFGTDSRPYISTSIIENANAGDPQVHYFNRHLQEFPEHENADELIIPDIILEKSGKYDFEFKYPDEFVFRGTINPVFASSPAKTIFEDGTGRRFNWKSIVPHGEFSGELVRENQVYPIDGLAYVDRNWGEVRIQEFVKDWVWGSFSDGSSSITFYDIMSRNGTRFGEILTTTQNGTVSSRLTESHLNAFSNLGNPHLLTRNLTIGGETVSMNLGVSPKKIMRNWNNRDFGEFYASYSRWATQSRVDFGGNNSEMFGITEHLRVRRVEDFTKKQNIILLTGLSGAGKSTVSGELAASLGLHSIDSRNVYHKLAGEGGYKSGREWLKEVGTSGFIDSVIDETVKQMSEQPEETSFVLDAVAGSGMVEKIQSQFPHAVTTIVALRAPTEVREARIARRQNLDLQEAYAERQFRDGFLDKSGVEFTMNSAVLTVDNEEEKLENTLGIITKFLEERKLI